MFVFDHPSFEGHESVHAFYDERSGLQAIIALHSTHLGPASGGCRLWSYENYDDAIDDVLRLSEGMSFKCAMAGLPLGGGKSVIIKPESDFDRAAIFAALGRAVDSLSGQYYVGEDVGVTPDDMKVVRRHTKFVGGLDDGDAASGDPSPVTADGVFRGMRAAIKHRLGSESFKGLTVAVQGVGHVGMYLCEHLHKAGAKLVVTDINDAALAEAKSRFGAKVVGLHDIYLETVDVFAPCALGRAINPDTISLLTAKIVAGAANNQLSTPEMGTALMRRDILFAPDYVVNAGGIINIASEISGTYDPVWVEGKLAELEATTADIFKKAEAARLPVNAMTDDMARKRIGR